jgi:hypothetical protein
LNSRSLIRKSRQLAIERSALRYDAIGKVLLIWDANQSKTDIEELKAFGHALRKSGKDITFLVFHPLKKFPPDIKANELHRLCCKSDFNFFQLPKSKELLELIRQPFDLLVNGCLSDHPYLTAIAVFSKAKFRVGPFLQNEDTNFYELMVKPNGADPCENYLIEIGRYLRKIE